METLISDATRTANFGMDLLRACNQSVELSKCGYHAITYSFQPTGEPTLVQCPHLAITLHGSNNLPFDVTHWDNSKATKYLGVYKCPSDQKKQSKFLLQQCKDFSGIVTCSHLTRRDTKCFCWAIYHLSVNYALPAEVLL